MFTLAFLMLSLVLPINLAYEFFILAAFFDKNQMLWDLGMSSQETENENILRKKLKLYHDEFDVVLITERFYESLIVMKEELCWDIQDLLFLKV